MEPREIAIAIAIGIGAVMVLVFLARRAPLGFVGACLLWPMTLILMVLGFFLGGAGGALFAFIVSMVIGYFAARDI